ncbi:MAG: Branched-chain amino acid transport ATP-binding protein LivF [uncultured Thermomicrobiales bacterium]|uniref:Branched-chain amino acid transport ATP-binding protein LivF n=1 Tax=uncultured Thermomicrobiales bacterium TaxID=1645740 RepID=A0A6J4UWD2_9BACT|nr:MAG: Branched-chain amino acid transport ATP-binding protein LivF [uncultured Thermomicrobiales bacterium]
MLEVTDLRVAYGQIEAVKGVSFRVPEGSIVTLVGANGAGKTTTLAAISGLLRPRAGAITFDGRELTRLGTHTITRLGVVQVPEGRDILATMTILENLELGAYGRRDRDAVRRDIARMLERFPILGQRRGLAAGSLSGGEQQMLAIARGLMARPKVFLLDEPSMGLAPQLVREVFRIVAELRAEGQTILLVEQNARKALAISDYAYVMESGRITLEGRGADLLTNDAMVSAYLGGIVIDAPPVVDPGPT